MSVGESERSESSPRDPLFLTIIFFCTGVRFVPGLFMLRFDCQLSIDLKSWVLLVYKRKKSLSDGKTLRTHAKT